MALYYGQVVDEYTLNEGGILCRPYLKVIALHSVLRQRQNCCLSQATAAAVDC